MKGKNLGTCLERKSAMKLVAGGIAGKIEVLVMTGALMLLGMGCSQKQNPVRQNYPPLFVNSSTAARSVGIDTQFTDTVRAIDPEGGSVTYLLAGAPSGAALNENVVSWTPGIQDSGVKTITVYAVDEAGGIGLVTLYYNVGAARFAEIHILASQVKAEVAAFRNKEFLRDVAVIVQTRAEYAAGHFGSGGSGGEMTAAERTLTSKALIAEGFLRAGDDFFGETDTMLSVGVGGFYVAGSDSLWIIVADSLERLDDGDRIKLFHEFVHALQDQHYGLEEFERRAQSSDQFFARRYTVEGEADYLTWYYAMKLYNGYYPPSSSTVMLLLSSYAQDVNERLDMLHSEGERYFVYQPFAWAYVYGPQFVGEVVGGMDWGLIDSRIFASPPVRMREVLKPSVYLIKNRSGYVVEMDSLMELMDKRWEIHDYDEFGALYTNILFREWGMESPMDISLGLVSDRAAVSGNDSGDSMSFCWYTHWADVKARDGFVLEYRLLLEKKYGSSLAQLSMDSGNYIMDDSINNRCYIETAGNDVLVMERYPGESKQAWLAALRKSTVANWAEVGKIRPLKTSGYTRIKKENIVGKTDMKLPNKM